MPAIQVCLVLHPSLFRCRPFAIIILFFDHLIISGELVGRAMDMDQLPMMVRFLEGMMVVELQGDSLEDIVVDQITWLVESHGSDSATILVGMEFSRRTVICRDQTYLKVILW
jgi:hypothetical protein